MALIQFDLDEGDLRDLDAAAISRGMTQAELVRRWIEERLLHERERAAGSGRNVQKREG